MANSITYDFWSATSKCRDAQSLYGLWKNRYVKLWRKLGKGRCESNSFLQLIELPKIVTFGRKSRSGNFGQTENAYCLQAYRILEKMSHQVAKTSFKRSTKIIAD
ncbi:hypothetical protein BDA99DRAFT_531219 [Phascolomyces articulosus]|uniref:Uncharacterized protein n=1 Tax=Phascolomyces articulosus TaxID=60185 RepID=A0AAD5KCJ2_9FUNG|nr:hypothetical protein BDA99DRAFT_531219 [Phascolomyces articulosus]